MIMYHSTSQLVQSMILAHLSFSIILQILCRKIGPYPYLGSWYLPSSAIAERIYWGLSRRGFRLGTYLDWEGYPEGSIYQKLALQLFIRIHHYELTNYNSFYY
jgi:hypothetical protein